MPEVKPKSFQRRFVEFATGTGVAQVLSLLLTPVISRIYSPDEMGEYAIYVAISSIISILANLRLDAPVVIAASEQEALDLVKMGQISSVFVATFSGFALYLYGRMAGLTWITPMFCGLVGTSVFGMGSVQSLVNYHNRHQNYKYLAVRNAVERLLYLTVSIAVGYLGLTRFGLPVGQSVGILFSLGFLFAVSGSHWVDLDWSRFRMVFQKYADFPYKNVASSLINALSNYGPALLFAAFFAKSDIGSFNLAARVFDAPIYLVGYTFHTIYYRHVSDKNSQEKRRLFWKSLRMLSYAMGGPLLLVAIGGDWLFVHVFGPQWALSGHFAVWLAPYTWMRLCFVSQAAVLLVERKLALDLFINLLQLSFQTLGFLLGYYLYGTVISSLAFMAVFGAISYMGGLALIYRAIPSHRGVE